MKKLVPKTFATKDAKKTQKKANKHSKQKISDVLNSDDCKKPDFQIIHAYQVKPPQYIPRESKPASKFTFQFASSFKAAATHHRVDREFKTKRPKSHLEDSHYYYSITELENLSVLDHRHAQCHQLSPEQHHLNLYHYQPVELQLPIAAAAGNVAMSTPSSSSPPIYEAPHSVALSATSNNASINNKNVLLNNITNDIASDGKDISRRNKNNNETADNDDVDVDGRQILSGLLPIELLLRHRPAMTTVATYAPNTLRKCSASLPVTRCAGGFNPVLPNTTLPLAEHLPALTAAVSQPQSRVSVKSMVADAEELADHLIEQSIIGARASVMVYDDIQKKWVPSGSSSGLSKVQIYHHQQNNTFRVVGRKLQDHEVVINCSILKGLKYNQATATFHQWRDSKLVYGLNFSSPHDAEAFARAMMHALEMLSGRVANNAGQPTNGNGYEEDMGYRTMTSEDAAILRQQQQITGQVTPSAQTPTSQTNQNNIPQSPPTPQQGHHRTSRTSLSAPPAPQPQQMSMPPQQQPHQPQQQQLQPQQQLYAQTGNNGPTQNGVMLQQQQQQQQQQPLQQPQITSVPAGQTQYHAPQQMQQEQQHPLPHQQQQQPLQHQQQPPQPSQHHQVYSSQQLVNPNYQQQQQNQYQQAHYVLSSSNPNLNLHQYSQQQAGAPQPPMPPPHQQNISGGGGPGPIYVSTQPPPPSQGIPSSASSNSVVYASQQHVASGVAAPMPPQPPQPLTQQNGPPAPPLPNSAANVYGQMNGPQNQTENLYSQIPAAPPMMAQSSGGGSVPAPPPLNRMSSGGSAVSGGGAPAAPPPPPAFGGPPPTVPPQMFNGGNASGPGAPPQPPAPPAPPAMAGPVAPPPPPPPPMGGLAAKKEDPSGDLMGSLAVQLQMAKLKKNKSVPLPAENSGSSTSSGGSGNYGTIGRSSNGMASMMDEMAKTLARRRAQAEKKEPEPEPDVKQRPWEKSNTLPHKLGSSSSNGNSNSRDNTSNSGSESPRPMRKRFGSASEETILKQVNGDGLSLALSGDLDSLKAEIVREMRLEIQKVKQEIIDAIKSEFNRR